MTFTIFNCPLFTFSKKVKNWKLDISGYWVIITGCYIEKDQELSLSLPNCSKDSWKLLPLLISITWPSLVTQWVVVQKINSKMHSVSCINTHHDVTDVVNHGMVKNKKKHEYLESGTLLKINKFLTCASDGTFWEVVVL